MRMLVIVPKHPSILVDRFDAKAQKKSSKMSLDSVCLLCQPNKSLPIASRMTYRRCMCSHFNVTDLGRVVLERYRNDVFS